MCAREFFRSARLGIGHDSIVMIDDDSTADAPRERLFASRYAKLSFSVVLAGSAGWLLFSSGAEVSADGDVLASVATASTAVDLATAEPPDVAEAVSRASEGPIATTWTDAAIGAAIHKRFQWDTALDADAIEIKVDEGTVALFGNVASALDKQRAIGGAWVAGVRDVDADGLDVVVPRRAPKRSAAHIERSIARALAVDPTVDGAAIEVRVREGRVVLRGTVRSLASARAAELVARHTPGVSFVEDELAVAAWGDDATIAADVAAALRETPRTAALAVEVGCDHGAVVLEGAVETFAQRMAAERVAVAIHGVQSIDNRLSVVAGDVAFYYDPHAEGFRPIAEPRVVFSAAEANDDERIASAIRAELALSRWVDGARIDVSVDAGAATLTGVVDTLDAHAAALANAHEGGAITVVDRLVVVHDPNLRGSAENRAGEAVFGRDD